jgi:hypothetical protein
MVVGLERCLECGLGLWLVLARINQGLIRGTCNHIYRAKHMADVGRLN